MTNPSKPAFSMPRKSVRRLGKSFGLSRKKYSPDDVLRILVEDRKVLVPRRRGGPGFELESFQGKEKLLELLAEKRPWDALDRKAKRRVVDVIIGGALEHARQEVVREESKRLPSVALPSSKWSARSHETVYHSIHEILLELYSESNDLEQDIAKMSRSKENVHRRKLIEKRYLMITNLKDYYRKTLRAISEGWGKEFP